MPLYLMRLLTTGIVLAGCGFAGIRGYDIVSFVQAQSDLSTAGRSAIGAWQDVPGLSGAALETSLAQMTQNEAPKRAPVLADMLAVRPLSPSSWLSLAGARVASGEGEAQVEAALTMSALTGPNEAEVMFQRGIFGLLRWDQLTERARQQSIRDLAGALQDDVVSDGGLRVLKGVLVTRTPENRAKIAAELRGDQVSAKQLEEIGL